MKKTFVFNVYNHKVSNELNQVIIFSLFSNNFLKVNIYFEDLNYEVISEEPLYDVSYVLFLSYLYCRFSHWYYYLENELHFFRTLFVIVKRYVNQF